MAKRDPSRKQLILESLARELEGKPGARVTTAALARATGISEAALYRHFASKAKMFEGLIAFAEETVFARINQIVEEEKNGQARCTKVIYLVLGFSARNPGITRVLLGDALVGETERLLARVDQFFSRLETHFRQILREIGLREQIGIAVEPEVGANLLLTLVEGRMHQFLRSRFTQSPLDGWEPQWALLAAGLFATHSAQGEVPATAGRKL